MGKVSVGRKVAKQSKETGERANGTCFPRLPRCITRLFDSMNFRLIIGFSMKRQICSYDMLAVPSSSYTVTDAEGEMYLCRKFASCLGHPAQLPHAWTLRQITLKYYAK
jgi:hypothetical protein